MDNANSFRTYCAQPTRDTFGVGAVKRTATLSGDSLEEDRDCSGTPNLSRGPRARQAEKGGRIPQEAP